MVLFHNSARLVLLCLAWVFISACNRPAPAKKQAASFSELKTIINRSDSLRAEDPERAYELAKLVLSTAKTNGDDSLRCAAFTRMAQTQMALGHFEKGIALYDSFLNACGKQFSELFLATQINLGSLYINLGNYKSAESAFAAAEQLANPMIHQRELLAMHQSRARLYYLIDNYDGMLADAQKALDLATQLNDLPRMAAAYTTLGLYYGDQGDMRHAMQYQQKALAVSTQIADSVSAMHIHINLAEIYGEKRLWDSTRHHLQKAKTLANVLGDQQTFIAALTTESYQLYEEANYRAAFDQLDKANSLHDSLVGLEQAEHLEELEVQFETKEKESEIQSLLTEQKISHLKQWFWIGAFILVILLGFALTFNLAQRRKHEKEDAQHRIDKLEQEKSVLALESMLYAQEEERQRIAKDLHDGIGALLSTARMQISKVEHELDKLKNIELVKNTEAIITRASKEVRRVSHNMMPGVLMELGLYDAIEDFLEKQPPEMAIDFVHQGLERRLSQEVEIMIFRIVQELVNNSNKHSQAKQADLSIISKDDTLTLEYQDNGLGFNRVEWDNLSNLGLNSIRSRAHFLKGRVNLETDLGKGVFYTIVIPIAYETV